jgi:diacylglycerol O-acyltransferase / wax synthase
MWETRAYVDAAGHVQHHKLTAGENELTVVLDEFWSRPLDICQLGWELLLLTDTTRDWCAIVIKLHHALADGVSTLNMMRALLDDRSPMLDRGSKEEPPRPSRRSLWSGLSQLARAGRAPRSAINDGPTAPARHLTLAGLPAKQVTAIARRLRVTPADVAVALMADAIHHCFPEAGASLRVLMPVSMSPRIRSWLHGNRTGALSLDLPTGPMPTVDRVGATGVELRRAMSGHQAAAAEFVIAVLGRLPSPVQARACRYIYTKRYFNLIVSVLPGVPGAGLVFGIPVSAAYPVVALAEGVHVGMAALRWGTTMCVGVLVDGTMADAGPRLRLNLDRALAELSRAVDG